MGVSRSLWCEAILILAFLATAQARYRQPDNSGCRNKKRHVFNDWALESTDSQTIPRPAIQDMKASNLDANKSLRDLRAIQELLALRWLGDLTSI
jgi:hypothetical protein